MDLDQLASLASQGADLLDGADAVDSHDDFERWCADVGEWLRSLHDGPSLVAEWHSLETSPLALGDGYYDDALSWRAFRKVIRRRLRWLSAVATRTQPTEALSRTVQVPPDFSRSVFLNCPFDDDFQPLREAAVFAIVMLGFHVRCALDTADGSRVRIQKLYDLIRSSRLGIHDLSRTELDERNNLPRFNMPLELGIFLGVKDSGGAPQDSKTALVTSSQWYDYQQYISDVAGQDVQAHHDSPEDFIGLIRDWLATETEDHLPSRSRVWERYRHFRAELPELCRRNSQDLDELTYRDFLKHVDEFCQDQEDELQLGSGLTVRGPSAIQITEAITGLPGGDDSFAIFSRSGSGLSYMQTAGGGDELFVLEYQEGSLDAHYRCTSLDLTAAQVARAMVQYAARDGRWRDELEWRNVDPLAPY